MKPLKKQLTSSQIIILGFAAVILLGSLVLMLPISTASGQWASFGDTLFTATSAVCVTGLVVQDTATYWSLFGQFVIIALIQVGGMGVVTVSIAIAAASGGRIGLRQRSLMQESISAPQVGGIIRLTRFILRMTLIFELAGAVLMFPVFCREFGPLRGLWYSIFHSISAFCNAGFDLMGIRSHFSSLTAFPTNPLINLTIMALIIIGGIGFLVWEDIAKNGLRFKRYRMQTKVVLATSALLTLIPALYFFFFEFQGSPLPTRIWTSIFQSVTTRTAGFNTADLTLLSETGINIMVILMLIGGSPGSTAGGMKTTTFAVLFANSIAIFRRKDNPNLFGRSIPDETIKTASTLLTMYLLMFLSGSMIMSRVENVPLVSCLFECGSAAGTVGLTLGLTPTLGIVSRIILILLMYLGRVGGLTLLFAAISAPKRTSARLPQEKLTVG